MCSVRRGPDRSLLGSTRELATPLPPVTPSVSTCSSLAVPSSDLLAPLLLDIASGHADAFPAFYDATTSRVYGLALRVLRSPEHAAEVTQDVYLDVWRLARQFDPARGRAVAWLLTMTHRRAVEAVRSTSASRARDERVGLWDQGAAVDEVWESVTIRADRVEAQDRIGAALQCLTETKREVLVMAYFGGMTQTEIATRLTIPLGTVKTRLRDGLTALRAAFGDEAAALG